MGGNSKQKIFILMIIVTLLVCCSGCTETDNDVSRQIAIGDELSGNQQTPTDIDYSLERYNLIRRAYWVNGQRDKANALVCEIAKPLGYILLLTESGKIIGRFVVDGKVTSLNSYLTPNEVTYNTSGHTKELPDVDGSYGENDNGIFFFTPDGKYVEWTGIYLYSDIPFDVDEMVIKGGE